MRIPRKVRIGRRTFDITTSPKMLEWAQKRETVAGTTPCLLDGYISFRHQRIVVNTKDCNAEHAKTSLAHEIVHGILEDSGYAHQWLTETGDDEYEERFTVRFTSAWLDTMQRNPSLVAYLTDAK